MSTDYQIRIATLADADAVGDLLCASYPLLMAPFYDEKVLALALEPITRANPSLLRSGTYYLAESSAGLLVGCGGWTLERPGTGTIEPGVGHLRHFAVHPDWTRRGIGRAIFNHCERAARAAGVRTFECYSVLNAESFYRALNFERVREMETELRPHVRIPAVLMRRDL